MAAVRPVSVPLPRRRPLIGRIPAWALLGIPAALYLGLTFLLPALRLLGYSVLVERPTEGVPAQFTLGHYQALFGESLYRSIMLRTLRIGLIVTVVDLLVSYPLAYAIVRTRSSALRAFLVFAVLSPLLTSIIVRTYGWMIILSDRGPINRSLLGLGLVDDPVRMLYNEFGVVVALVQVFVPFMVLPLTSSLQTIDPALEQAAQSLRANRLQTFARVTLPLSAPGIVTGSVLVFILAIGAFITPVLLGSARTTMLAVLIREQILGLFNWSFAAAAAGVLLFSTLVLLGLYARAVRRWAM